MRLFRRLLPFSTAGGAAWFAFRHRELLWDWGTWTAQALPRAVGGNAGDVMKEAWLRARLSGDDRVGARGVDVRVIDGQASLRGEVGPGGRVLATQLARDVPGIAGVSDELRERQAQPTG
jgi:hypothetical protein